MRAEVTARSAWHYPSEQVIAASLGSASLKWIPAANSSAPVSLSDRVIARRKTSRGTRCLQYGRLASRGSDGQSIRRYGEVKAADGRTRQHLLYLADPAPPPPAPRNPMVPWPSSLTLSGIPPRSCQASEIYDVCSGAGNILAVSGALVQNTGGICSLTKGRMEAGPIMLKLRPCTSCCS